MLTQRPRVALTVIRGSLLIEDAIPRQVEVVIRDAHQRTVLFRSTPTTITPDQEQVSITVPAIDGAIAERGTQLLIEVRDTHTEDVLATGESVLMTELTGW